jgi:midasin
MLSKSLLVDSDTARDLNQRLDGFGLSTGVHMENLWKAFRPAAPVSEEQLHTLLQLEDLARRFDAIRWNAFKSTDTVNDLVSSLAQAYRKVLMDKAPGEHLVKVRIHVPICGRS